MNPVHDNGTANNSKWLCGRRKPMANQVVRRNPKGLGKKL